MKESEIRKIFQVKQSSCGASDYNIVCCLDNKVVYPLCAMILSARKSLKLPVNFWVLQSDFTSLQIELLKDFSVKYDFGLKIIDIDPLKFKIFQDYIGANVYPVQCFYYLLAHEYLPIDMDRALFVDVDVMFLKDIYDFYTLDFEDTWLAGMVDYDTISINEKINFLEGKCEHVYSRFRNSETIVNTGVLLLNLKKYRDEEVSCDTYKRLFQTEVDRVISLPDQTLVNRFVGVNVKVLPAYYYNCFAPKIDKYPKWFAQNEGVNESYIYNELDEDKAVSIVHFVTCGKPWGRVINLNRDMELEYIPASPELQPLYEAWWNYARQLPPIIYQQILATSINSHVGWSRIEYAKKLQEYRLNEIASPSERIWNKYFYEFAYPADLYFISDPDAECQEAMINLQMSMLIRHEKDLFQCGLYIRKNVCNTISVEDMITMLANSFQLVKAPDVSGLALWSRPRDAPLSRQLFYDLYYAVKRNLIGVSELSYNIKLNYVHLISYHGTQITAQQGRLVAESPEKLSSRTLDTYLIQDRFLVLRLCADGTYLSFLDELGNCSFNEHIMCFPVSFVGLRKLQIRYGKRFFSVCKNNQITLAPAAKRWETFSF